MKFAITGASGMIGRHIKAHIKSQGFDCISITRSEWDLFEWKSYEQFDYLFKNVDGIFHFGAALPGKSKALLNQENRFLFDANVRSCLNLAEWSNANKVPIVFLSGATVYADTYAPKILESAPKVKNGFGGFYGYTKLLAEKVFDHFVADGLKITILRPSSVYGIGLGEDKMISKFLSLAKNDKTISVNNVNSKINLIHAIDVSKAALSALLNESWGVYNIASATNISIKEIAECCVEACGSGKIEYEFNENEISFVRFDLDFTKANKFNYKPSINLNKGIKLMIKESLIC